MKIVFFGNPEFAAKALGYISDFNDITIDLVITNPDKKMGRGLNKKMSPVKKTASQSQDGVDRNYGKGHLYCFWEYFFRTRRISFEHLHTTYF